MNLEEAKEVLNRCIRSESRNPSFGDTEVYWEDGEDEIAVGYFNAAIEQVDIVGSDTPFVGFDARALRNCGMQTASHGK